MRFCPFCSAENPAEATHCATCARRLPPLPPRRQRAMTQPSGVTAPAAVTPAPAPAPAPVPAPVEPAAPAAATPATPATPAPAGPPPTAALLPSPAAARRPTAPPEPPESRAAGAPARRRTDASSPLPPLTGRKRTTIPPPIPTGPRKSTTIPPPIPGARAGSSPSGVTPAPAPAAATPTFDPTITPLPPPPVVARPDSPPPAAGTDPGAPPPTPTPAPLRDATSVDPPPTRIARPHELADRPFTPPKVIPIPEVPEPGLMNAVRYAVTFLRARWQRRGAIRALGEEIKQDTAALDLVLGTLGHAARQAKVESRALAGENAAIDAAEERKRRLEEANAELSSRKNDETAKFTELERERLEKVAEAERLLEDTGAEVSSLEAQRRSLRDKRKEVERRQRAYLKAAEDRDTEAGNAPLGETRSEMRRLAEGHRREAAALEPERQDLDRRLAALERPLTAAQAKVDAARAEVESARRSLHDVREGHRHRLAEIEAEQGRKAREVAQGEAEIQRRLVTLGTLINLNRIDHPSFAELYERIDRLRMAIGARTTEIDKLTAEREAYDKGSLVRGFVTLGGGVVVLITLFVILLAMI